MTSHLSHEQLCDLLLSGNSRDAWILSSPELEAARDHLQDCLHCTEELRSLGESMQLLRSSANAWSSQAWSQRPLVNAHALRPAVKVSRFSNLLPRPMVWAATAMLAIAVAIPVALHRSGNDAEVAEKRTVPVKATVSDEALFEEISQTLSSSVPSPMQPLADPTGQNSAAQRKN